MPGLPLLIFDGDCGFCKYWVRVWQKLTGDRLAYAPYQEVADQYPQIPVDQFQRAVKYVAADGRISSGAEAAFLALSHAEGKGYWITLYRDVPGFAQAAEFAYAIVAANRTMASRVSRWLWGRDYEPPSYELVSWLFLRATGLIYLSAFLSFAVQALGLIGSRGILPLASFMDAIQSQLGNSGLWQFPMVFWISHSDFAIQAVCWTGAALSLMLIFDVAPRVSLLLLYVLYLSLFYAGQTFMGFQWDLLLLEAGFLALFLSIATRPGIWLLRWFLFRFMFLSGSVKLLSGDQTWANLSALSYYFQTEPLPTPFAWYAHHLPQAILTAATVATLAIELGVPFLIFFPRRLRFAAAYAIILLQVIILLTGNYAFFNLLTIALCIPAFDDGAIRKIVPNRALEFLRNRAHEARPGRLVRDAARAVAVVIVFVGVVQVGEVYGHVLSVPGMWLDQQIAPLRIVNSYGLFAVMTTTRPEIIVQGSNDGVEWREYGFKYKPGDVMRAPRWNFPHQPRLDWQMWFAALGSVSENPWFIMFLQRLLEGSPEVLSLMGTNPFPDHPPRYIRAVVYDYKYSSPEVKRTSGAWWVRTPEGTYYPAVTLRQ